MAAIRTRAPPARALPPITLLVATLLLGACAPAPPRVPALAVAIPWPQHLQRLRSIVGFSLRGRIAANHGNEGFSAGLRWQQHANAADLTLTGPLGFGTALIELAGQQLKVTTGKGVRLDGAAAAAQLTAMLGFKPPLSSLRYWVLGESDPASGAEHRLDGRQRLAHLQQDGWQIDYDEYTAVQPPSPAQPALWLPRRLTVTRGDLRLKLVINAWQL